MDKTVGTIQRNIREELRFELTAFKGRDQVAVRMFVDDGSGMVPTRNGLTVGIGWLPDIIANLKAVEAEAKAAGMLD